MEVKEIKLVPHLDAVKRRLDALMTSRFTLSLEQRQSVLNALTGGSPDIGSLSRLAQTIGQELQRVLPEESTAILEVMKHEAGLQADLTDVQYLVADSGHQTREDFYREDKIEQERKDPVTRAQKKLDEVNTRLATLVNDQVRRFWSRPIDDLIEALNNEGLASVGAVDEFGLPEGDVDTNTAGATTVKFIKGLPARGYTLSSDGQLRFMNFVVTQVLSTKVAVTDDTLHAMLTRLVDFGCFGPGEITVPTPEPEAPKPVLTERQQVERDYYEKSVAPLHEAWLASLAANFNWQPSVEILQHLYGTDNHDPAHWGWFRDSNLSLTDRRSYDMARRHLVAVGLAPRKLLTADEVLAQRIEQTGNSYEERQDVRKRLFGGEYSSTTIMTNSPNRPKR
jgi:hypothetical protein